MVKSNYCSVKKNVKVKEVSWSKPMPGLCKLNIDASFHVDGSGAPGAVLKVKLLRELHALMIISSVLS